MATFKGKLYGFQEEGVEFALKNPYHLNGFQPGLGKTATSLAVAVKLNVKTLVIAPAFLRKNWLSEIKKFTEGLDIEVISYGQLTKYAEFVTNKKADNYGDFIRLKDDIPDYQFIISDEAHYLKNHTAKRTIAAHELVKAIKPHSVMLMSGTPIKNRVSEAWSLLQLCYYGGGYKDFQPFHRLYYKFCESFSFERTFEVNGIPIVRFDGVKNAQGLRDLIKPIYIRRRAEDVLDLPESVDTDIIGKSTKRYDEKLKEALELYKINPKDPAYMSLKAANALATVPDSIKMIQDLVDQDKKVIIFSCHREAARRIAEKFQVVHIDGTMKADDRQSLIDRYNRASKGVLVATIGAASTGFNITSANYMVINDLPFTPEDLEQAKRRMKRIGQTKTCFYYYMYSSDFAKGLYDMNARKSRDIGKIYD